MLRAIRQYNKEAPAGKRISVDTLRRSIRQRRKANVTKAAGRPLSKSSRAINAEIRKLYPEAVLVQPAAKLQKGTGTSQ